MSTSPDARATPAAIERQIEFERVSTLYAVAPPTLIGGIAYALLVAVMLWSLVPRGVLVAWVAFKVLLGALRLAGYRVDVVEFVESKHTPRNTLLRAVRTGAEPSEQARTELAGLTDTWGVRPRLVELLDAETR